jgi:hypothetical protein
VEPIARGGQDHLGHDFRRFQGNMVPVAPADTDALILLEPLNSCPPNSVEALSIWAIG